MSGRGRDANVSPDQAMSPPSSLRKSNRPRESAEMVDDSIEIFPPSCALNLMAYGSCFPSSCLSAEAAGQVGGENGLDSYAHERRVIDGAPTSLGAFDQ